MSMYLGNELVTGTKIRKIQVQNLATGESDYYYFGEPCDEGDIMNAIYQIKVAYLRIQGNARRYKAAAELYRQDAIDALDIAIERYDEMAEEYQKKADIERNDYMDMRDDAYEARQLAQWLNELKYLRGKIEQLTIKPEQRWIPCSERLPEAEDCPMDCLVTRKSKYIGNYTDMAVCEKNGMWTHEDWDAIVLGDVKDGKSTGLISTRDDDIIAWMPLPEPYKGGEQDG